jgi:hypothetical protein
MTEEAREIAPSHLLSVHPARQLERPSSAGLLAPGSSRVARLPAPEILAQWLNGQPIPRSQLRGQPEYRTLFPLRLTHSLEAREQPMTSRPQYSPSFVAARLRSASLTRGVRISSAWRLTASCRLCRYGTVENDAWLNHSPADTRQGATNYCP